MKVRLKVVRIAPTLRAIAVFASLMPLSLLAVAVPGLDWPWHLALTAFALALIVDGLLLPRRAAFALSRKSPVQVMQGEVIAIEIELRSNARIGVVAEVWEAHGDGGIAGAHHAREYLAAGGTRVIKRAVERTARGRHALESMRVELRTRLGLLTRAFDVRAPIETSVYPDTRLLPRALLIARGDPASPEGRLRLRLPEEGREFEALRDYAKGDDPRHIEWKVTARRRKPVVKTYQAQKGQSIFIALDTGRLMAAETAGRSKLDEAIASALVVAGVALARGDHVGLATYSGQVHSYLEPDRRPGQLRRMLATLHDTFPRLVETNHARSLITIRSRLKRRSFVLVFSDFVDSLTSEEMFAQLHIMARRHRMVFVGVRDPYLDAQLALQVRDVDALHEKVAASTLDRDRKIVLARLRHAGLEVLDLAPGHLAIPALDAYLRLVAGRRVPVSALA